jgi:DNA polymerase I
VKKAPGYEADDFLAAVAAEKQRPRTVRGASDDRDAFQLAGATTILGPMRAGEMARIGPAKVRNRYGVNPDQVPDFSPFAVPG